MNWFSKTRGLQKPVSGGVLYKKLLKNLQHSQKRTCARVSVLIKLQASELGKRTW